MNVRGLTRSCCLVCWVGPSEGGAEHCQEVVSRELWLFASWVDLADSSDGNASLVFSAQLEVRVLAFKDSGILRFLFFTVITVAKCYSYNSRV